MRLLKAATGNSYEKKLDVAPCVYMLRFINDDDVKVQYYLPYPEDEGSAYDDAQPVGKLYV